MRFIQRTMWTLFKPSFQKQLFVFGVTDSQKVMSNAKAKYQEIVSDIPRFEKNDVLLVTLLNAATLAAIYLSLEEHPSLEQITKYYDAAMSDSLVMRTYLKGSNYYSKSYQRSLARQAQRSQNSINPYSWKFHFEAGASVDCFDAIFDRCGICTLFSKLGISKITPALCAYDYGMAKLTKTEFSRQYTLAGGGAVCDCHYQKVKE